MPGLKHIIVPPEIILKELPSGETVLVDGKPLTMSFSTFVFRILSHESFMSSFEMLRTAHAIADAVKDANPGDVVAIAEDDLTRFAQSMREHFSTIGLVSLGLIQLMPFFNAIQKTTD